MRSAPLVLAAFVAGAASAAAGCRAGADELGGIFYDGDGRLVHCAVNLDESAGVSLGSIDSALDRAAERGEVVELYAHRPGVTVQVEKLAHVLAGAQARGLAAVTYADMAGGAHPGAGLALSFDDASVAEWYALRPLFQEHRARATFFVSRFYSIDDEHRAQLRELAADGHEIGAHGVMHLRAPLVVEEDGLAAYLEHEAVPSIEVLRDEGYEVRAFAYPYGARTEEIDRALAAHVEVLRSVAFPVHGPIGPCPR